METSTAQEQTCSQERCGELGVLSTFMLGVMLFFVAVVANQTLSFAASYHQFPYMPLPSQEV